MFWTLRFHIDVFLFVGWDHVLRKHTLLNNFPLLAVVSWGGTGGGNSGSTHSGLRTWFAFCSRKRW